MAKMPDDWNDQNGWEQYFKSLTEAITLPTVSSSIEGLRFLPFARNSGKTVWFPGCGIDLSPAVYYALGFHVYATDVSPSAIRWQRQLSTGNMSQIISDWPVVVQTYAEGKPSSGEFCAEVQDFRDATPDSRIDTVINIRAFQKFDPQSLRQAACQFYQALRPGGTAIFDTMNVQGKHRILLEDTLLEAGFYLPYYETERWYQTTLDATGIVYVMILGRPIVPHWEQYPENKFEDCRKRDQAILDSFSEEYKTRCQHEQKMVEETISNKQTKIAYMVYNTG